MQNTTGQLIERIVARKLTQDRRNVPLPLNRIGFKTTRENAAIFAYDVYQEEKTNSGRSSRRGRCVQQSATQTAGGTPCTIWRQRNAHKMAGSSTPGQKGRHVTWELDLHHPITDDGTSTRHPPVPCPLQCLHKGTCGSDQQLLSKVLTLADDGLIYKTASDTHTACGHCCSGAAGKCVTMVPRDRVYITKSRVQEQYVVRPRPIPTPPPPPSPCTTSASRH